MATAMECEEDLDATRRYDRILQNWNEVKLVLKNWNEGKGTPLPPDAPKWRGAALRFFLVNGPNPAYGIAQRARDIVLCFEIPKIKPGYFSSDDEDEDEEYVQLRVERLKESLDELEAYDGESIDVATLLHSDGYLFPFLRDVFSNKHACIRAKAAQLITSMVQNHPTTQQLLIDVNGLQLLLHNFTTDPDATSRTKTLGAISSLIQNNESGITVFLRENGIEALRNALTVLQGSSTYNEVVNLIGYLRRESSLSLRKEGGNSGQLGKNDDKPQQDNSKKRRNYYSSLKRLKQFNKLHLPPFQKKGRSTSSSKRMKLH